ncbi:MAG TPA: DUF3606 domain-containing protein [Thermoanaerobaculia bacterium]
MDETNSRTSRKTRGGHIMNDTKRNSPRVTREHRLQLVPHDHSRINIADYAELAYWCAHFQCTGSALRAAVAAVGPSSRAVASHLRTMSVG